MLNLNDLSPRSSLSPVVFCACSYSPFISQMKKYLPNLHWGNNGLFFNRSYTRPLNYDQLYLLETRKMKRRPACSSHRERLFNLLRSWIFHSRSLAIPLCLHLWSHTNHRRNGFCRWIDRADFTSLSKLSTLERVGSFSSQYWGGNWSLFGDGTRSCPLWSAGLLWSLFSFSIVFLLSIVLVFIFKESN